MRGKPVKGLASSDEVQLAQRLAAHQAAVAEELADQLTASRYDGDELRKELAEQVSTGHAIAEYYAKSKPDMAAAAVEYENDVLKFELSSLQQRLATFNYDELVEQNHALREEVLRLQSENVDLTKQTGDNGETSRRDVARIQLLLEDQYRSTLKGAEARLKEELFQEMTNNQRDLVSRHAEVMDNVKVLKSSQALVEGQLERAVGQRNEAKVDADIARAMQTMQSKEIVIVRHRLHAAQQRIKVLQDMLTTTYRAHPQLLQWALSNQDTFRASAGGADTLPGLAAERLSSSQMVPAEAVEAVQKLKDSVTRLRRQRDQWKERAMRVKAVCMRTQADLHAMTQIAQQALPDGGGFQSMQSVWTKDMSALDLYLEDSAQLAAPSPPESQREGPPKARLLSEYELQALSGAMSLPSAAAGASPRLKTAKTAGILKTASMLPVKSPTKGAKKGVSLHESQNITHNLPAAPESSEPRIPSIQEMLEIEAAQRTASRQAADGARGGSEFLRTGMLDSEDHLRSFELEEQQSAAAGEVQRLFSIASRHENGELVLDDSALDAINAVLAFDRKQVPSAPPLQFYDAAGMLEHMSYSPVTAETPAYFKVNKAQWQDDEDSEQSNPFMRTARHRDDAPKAPEPPGLTSFSAYDDVPAPMAQLEPAEQGDGFVSFFAAYDSTGTASGSLPFSAYDDVPAPMAPLEPAEQGDGFGVPRFKYFAAYSDGTASGSLPAGYDSELLPQTSITPIRPPSHLKLKSSLPRDPPSSAPPPGPPLATFSGVTPTGVIGGVSEGRSPGGALPSAAEGIAGPAEPTSPGSPGTPWFLKGAAAECGGPVDAHAISAKAELVEPDSPGSPGTPWFLKDNGAAPAPSVGVAADIGRAHMLTSVPGTWEQTNTAEEASGAMFSMTLQERAAIDDEGVDSDMGSGQAGRDDNESDDGGASPGAFSQYASTMRGAASKPSAHVMRQARFASTGRLGGDAHGLEPPTSEAGDGVVGRPLQGGHGASDSDGADDDNADEDIAELMDASARHIQQLQEVMGVALNMRKQQTGPQPAARAPAVVSSRGLHAASGTGPQGRADQRQRPQSAPYSVSRLYLAPGRVPPNVKSSAPKRPESSVSSASRQAKAAINIAERRKASLRLAKDWASSQQSGRVAYGSVNQFRAEAMFASSR